MMANVLIEVQRFNPETDEKPYMQTYEVSEEILKGMTIFDALAYIKDKLDPTLTYRAFCRSAICGSCAMKINNRAKLACKEQILFHVRNGKVKIKPLENAKIIRDLAVQDKSKIFNTDLISLLEFNNIMELAEVLILTSLDRKESRGSFSRDDYPTRDDENYLYHSMATLQNGEIKLDKSEVDISLYEPAERKY